MIDDREPDRSVPIAKNDLRSDRWLSNSEEIAFNELNDFLGVPRGPNARLDVWDPDTDDDGLTDGQELYGLTLGEAGFGSRGIIVDDRTVGTSPVLPDSDGDGYWDGHIGVFSVGRTDDVVLYEEHLVSDRNDDGLDGIESGEIVSEQTGIHKVNDSHMTASALTATFDGDEYHSNVHLGELHWQAYDSSQAADPDDPNETPAPRIDVEVDWIEGHNPYQRTQDGRNLLEATEQNFALYGLDMNFHSSESISKTQLRNTFKGFVAVGTVPIPAYISPDSLNAKEMSVIENEFHDDPSRLHLLFANEYGSDEPSFWPHDSFIPEGVNGLEGHTGSPGQVAALETIGPPPVPYGGVILDNETSSFDQTLPLLLHELGHAWGAGWIDDKGPGHIAECYSGIDCQSGSVIGVVDVGGGLEETPERVSSLNQDPDDWSIMSYSNQAVELSNGRFAFSLEELSTVDEEDIPSRND